MAAQVKQSLTPEEYFLLEEKAEYKSEYRDGEMIAMAGGDPDHSLIAANIVGALINELKGTCRVYNSDVMVQSGVSYSYPDVTVVCGEPRYGGERGKCLANPVLLIEVLSKSTEALDRGEKFALYRRIESLSGYLLVAQDKPRVEYYTRQADGLWLLSEINGVDALVKLNSLKIDLRLASVYAFMNFDHSNPEREDS